MYQTIQSFFSAGQTKIEKALRLATVVGAAVFLLIGVSSVSNVFSGNFIAVHTAYGATASSSYSSSTWNGGPSVLAPCTISADQFELDIKNGSIVASNVKLGTSTASFKLSNYTSCTVQTSLSSYKMSVAQGQPQWLSTQQIVDATSSSIAGNSSTTLTVALPSCKAQVDAWYGAAPTSLLDTNPYSYPNVPFVINYAFSSSQLCTNGSGGTPTSTPSSTTGTLIVVTNVANTNGGVKSASDFSDTVSGTNVMPTSTFTASASGTTLTLSAGSFAVIQNPSAGYNVSYSSDCAGTIAAGDTKTCTITDNDKPLPAPVCSTNGLYGTYYNLPNTLPGMEGTITGVVTGTTPFQYNWYTMQFFSFASTTPITAFDQPQNFFPVNDGLPGDPFYTAIHWTGYVTFPASGTYSINLGSDDDSWFYINNNLVVDNGGVHALTYATSSITVTGAETLPVDLYFAERHTTQSGIVFQMPGVTFSPCAPSGSSTPSADISIVKTVDNAAPSVGDTVNYTLTVNDLGPATSTGVIATDTLPSGLTFENATASVGTYASSTGTWTIGNLSASSTATLNIAA